MDKSWLYKLALTYIPGVGDKTTRQLLSYAGSVEGIFNLTKGKLLKIPGIGSITATAITNKTPLLKAERELFEIEKEHIDLLFFTDNNYPKKLKLINDAPILLYHKGNANLNNPKILAIVGTRKATPYGRLMVEKILCEMGKTNCQIISGFALGIDIAAHLSAMKNDLETVAVMGAGFKHIYPKQHNKYIPELLNNGSILTEQKLNVFPDRHNFPSRNRIVAGLADGVLVIEAGQKSGTLITADLANGYNREVMAVPGNVHQQTSHGCNWLIKTNRAHLVETAQDVIDCLNWDLDNQKPKLKEQKNYSHLNEQQLQLVKVLEEFNILNIDEISWKTQIPINRVGSLLTELELMGEITYHPGKKITLT